jgi:hypothetical protein
VEPVKTTAIQTFLKKNQVILLDTLFLLSYLAAIILLVVGVFVPIFVVPAIVFCVLWLALSLTVSRMQGSDIRRLIRHGKVLPSAGLPFDRDVHAIYTGALLVSFMLFFSLMVVMKELSMMVAFLSWLFVGFATLQDIGERENSQEKAEAH